MANYTITVSDDYATPEGQLETNEAYVTFVMNKAAESYKTQYSAETVEAGITAAREAYNASVAPTPEGEPE